MVGGGQVRSNGAHAVLQVLVKLYSVFRECNDLVAQRLDVGDVVGDLGANGDLHSLLELLLCLFIDNVCEVALNTVGSRSHHRGALGIGHVLRDNLANLGKCQPYHSRTRMV